jgi:hypothetical protein
MPLVVLSNPVTNAQQKHGIHAQSAAPIPAMLMLPQLNYHMQ